MEESEYRVWKRVMEQPRQEAIGERLYHMAKISRQALRDYRSLANGCREAAHTAGDLERWERENLEGILGLFRLSVGRPMGDPGRTGKNLCSAEDTVLYRRALEQLQEYMALSAQPQFGVVFGEMAQRQHRICEAIVRLLGKQARK